MQDGLILNRYRPITQAGAGGFSTVQLAWDTRIQRRVAIKCMHIGPEDAEEPQSPDATLSSYDAADIPGLDEARTAAMLQDPNIVGVYDFEVAGNTAYLIMEYVEGMTLTQLIKQCEDQMDLDVVGHIFQCVAHAVDFAHDNQVLHLDIKPDNVLIDRKGQVKVTDFGLSRLSDVAGYAHAAGGTIGYMPPEQMNQDALDARCDEWALASLTYEMIAGGNPFWADTLDQAQARIRDAEVILPSLCIEGLDPQADDVLFYALDPDRDERYDSVQDFAEELQPFLGNPSKGKRKLAAIVGQACVDDEEEIEEEIDQQVEPIYRMSNRAKSGFMRLWSTVGSAAMAALSLLSINVLGGVTGLAYWGVVALVGLGAALVPHVGAFLAMAALAAALFYNGAYLCGAIVVVAACAWWFFVGRNGKAQACTVLGAPLFGSIGGAQIAPLLCGYFLQIKDALINAVMNIILFVMVAGLVGQTSGVMGFGDALFDTLTRSQGELGQNVTSCALSILSDPFSWMVFGSWIIVALVMSLMCRWNNRGLALLGVVVCGVVQLGIIYLSSSVLQITMPSSSLVLYAGTIIPLIVVAVLCCFGVPPRLTREEEEEDDDEE